MQISFNTIYIYTHNYLFIKPYISNFSIDTTVVQKTPLPFNKNDPKQENFGSES